VTNGKPFSVRRFAGESSARRLSQRKLKPLTGKTLAEVALRGKSPEETAIDLVIEDGSRVDTVYFLVSEENVRKQIKLPWISFNSDAASLAPEGVFLKSNPHPRAYGNFARLLGKYVRDERVLSLEEAVRRLTSLPAENLKLDRRGRLKADYFADVVVFDPARVRDHATFENRISIPPVSSTSSSMGCKCSRTGNTRGPSRAVSCAGRAGRRVKARGSKPSGERAKF
jgi:N-acyl-D-amino-acid deacylase